MRSIIDNYIEAKKRRNHPNVNKFQEENNWNITNCCFTCIHHVFDVDGDDDSFCTIDKKYKCETSDTAICDYFKRNT